MKIDAYNFEIARKMLSDIEHEVSESTADDFDKKRVKNKCESLKTFMTRCERELL